jgi:hypothetical protein
MEGYPYEKGGLEYLFGVSYRQSGELVFKGFWGHDRQGEKKAFEEFIDFVSERLRLYPNLHIYHYADYERRALRGLMQIHGVREKEVDQILRDQRLVDLYTVVRESIMTSEPRYSIKNLETFYMKGERKSDVKTAGDSIVFYEKWRLDKEQKWLDNIENYNKDDCISTKKLHDWLSNKLTAYLRRDFATPDDQFVKAADNNQLLHFVNKPIPKRPDLDPYYKRINDSSYIDSLPYVRKAEGFEPQGVAKTEYGKRAETLTDASAWPVQLEDITSPGLIPRNMDRTDPSARLTELGASVDEMLQFDKLAGDMERMRNMPKTYSAYSQPGIKVPEEYLLTDEALIGLTPAQASNRAARFRNWEEENRQRMASKFAKEDPRLSREELPGKFTAVALPDLQKSPEIKQLAMDVGCDGNWCTKEQSSALSYGSGDSRLHIILDEKARPMAQITFTRLPPTKRQLEADPSADDRFSITELLGKDNSKDFSKNPALPAIQQYIKLLDRRHDLRFMTNLNEIGMKELSIEDTMRGAKELSNRRQRYTPGIDPEEYRAASDRDFNDFKTAVQSINGGSKYLTKDQDVDLLIQQALERLAPQQRAKGGMVERQSTDNRRYM